jgi:predicted hydrocarbon binding protein
MSEEVRMATNMSIRAAIDGVSEILGHSGTSIIFRNIGLADIFENPPDYDWEPCLPTSEQVKIYTELVNLLGLNGAISIWRRIGYTNIKYTVEIARVLDQFESLPPKERFFEAVRLFCFGSGKGRAVANEDTGADLDIFDCLLCEGYTSKRPICSLYEGILQYACDWAFGKGVYIARETRCMARGDDTCYFVLTERE